MSQDSARVERAALENGVRSIVIRAGDFFGGQRPESWLDLMILKDLKKNTFTWPGPWDMPHAFAYLPDLAQAFVALARAVGDEVRSAELPPDRAGVHDR